MRNTIWIALAATLAIGGSAAAADVADGGASMDAVGPFLGRWAPEGSCEDASRAFTITSNGERLTLTTGEASSNEDIESDNGQGTLITSGDGSRYSYRINDDDDLVITDLGDGSREVYASCGGGDEDAIESEEAGKDEDVDPDVDANPDPDLDKS